MTDLRTQLADERGAILMIVSASMVAIVFIVALVVDRVNQFEHKRHLQTQVDAAALAGADSIALPLTSCSNTTINTAAHNYGGKDALHSTALYNSQIGGTPASNMHILVNSAVYWSPGDTTAVDNSGGAPCDSTNNRFCPGSVGIDVKGTEMDLPWLVGFGLTSTKINAHARVCLMAQTSAATALPIAIPNPKPRTAAAILVNKNTGAPIKITTSPDTYGVPLSECQNPAPPASPTCPTLDTWTSSATTLSSIPPETGVYILLSGLSSVDLTGTTLTTLCDQPLTSCFDAANDPPTAAVNFIRGWSGASASTTAPPILRDVRLYPNGSCSSTYGDQYFQAISSNCSVDIEAVVDAGGTSRSKMTITVAGAGCPNKGCVLKPDNSGNPTTWPRCQALGGSGECWFGSTSASNAIPILANAGAQPLTIGWNVSVGTINGQDCTKGQGCSGTFTNPDNSTVAAQPYTGDNNPKDANSVNSGPLKVVEILGCSSGGGSCATPFANSLPLGQPNTIAITVGLEGALHDAQSASDPDASCTFADGTTHQFACMKVVVASGGSGSTQSVDCDPFSSTNNKLEDQIANGCQPEYKLNTGASGPWTPCPNKTNLDDPVNGHNGDNNHPQPWQCVALFTGNKVTAVGNGLNRRIFGTPPPTPLSCPAYGTNGHNNWGMYDPNAATDGNANPSTDGFPPGDKRIVGVYLTAYGAFSHTAGTSLTIPVTDFATFYVTGYDQSPCSTDPAFNPHPDDPIPDKGTIVGHFIKYVNKINSGGGTLACDPNSFGACVPVMTK